MFAADWLCKFDCRALRNIRFEMKLFGVAPSFNWLQGCMFLLLLYRNIELLSLMYTWDKVNEVSENICHSPQNLVHRDFCFCL